MGLRIYDSNVNIVSFCKDDKNYAATIAWAAQVGYDYIVLLLGSQSNTGTAIEKGDIIGISVLNRNQKDIASFIGETHSSDVDKFKNLVLNEYHKAYTLKNAVYEIYAEVIDILHLKEIEDDKLVYVKVLKYTKNNGEYLRMGDFDE